MKRLILPAIFCFLISCAPDEPAEAPPAKIEKKSEKKAEKKVIEKTLPVIEKKADPEPVKPEVSVKTGWDNEDTYTVRASAANEPMAVDKAHYQILKDIVNVRVRSFSPYTDISKIKEEFKDPLKNGKIIQRNQKNGELEIFYQITDKGLKKKFERK